MIEKLKSFVKRFVALFRTRNISSQKVDVPFNVTVDVDELPNAPKSAREKIRWIVRHAARSKRRRRKYRYSSISARIMEDYGDILSRRQRKDLSRRTGRPFIAYYN